MKLLLLAIVGNESDIIESFVRHNVPLFDRTLIVDDDSTDGTTEILCRLKDEGYDLEIESLDNPTRPHAKIINSRYLGLLRENSFDFVIVLEPDEFIKCSDKEEFKSSFRRLDTKYYFRVEDYVYGQNDGSDRSDPVKGMVRRKRTSVGRKIVLPNIGPLSRRMHLKSENCDFAVPGHPFDFSPLPMPIAKFPVRSMRQFEKRMTMEWLTHIARGEVEKNIFKGSAWSAIGEKLRTAALTDRDLTLISYHYRDPGNAKIDAAKAMDSLDLVDDPLERNYGSLKWGVPAGNSALDLALFSEKAIRYSVYRNGRMRWLARGRIMVTGMTGKMVQYDFRTNAGKVLRRLAPRKCRSLMERALHYASERKAVSNARPYLLGKNAFLRSDKKTILYVSGKRHIPFATIRYRCYNLLDYLREAGWAGYLLLEEDIDSLQESILQSPPALCVLIRLESDRRISEFIGRLRDSGTKIVYDLDDFVFDNEMEVENTSGQFLPYDEKKDISHNGDEPPKYGYIPLMRTSNAVTGTTTALVAEEKRISEHCHKIPNSIARFQEAIAASIAGKKSTDEVVIGYFSGSPTHNTDFLAAAEQLYRVLRENRSVKFVLVGHLELPDYYSLLPSGQLRRHSVQNAVGYFNLLSTCDINIVPLEIRRANHCKSELKVFEAAALSIPSIVSPTSPHVECIDNWENGVIAYSYEDWSLSLKRLVDDPQLRNKLGRAAKATIGERFSYRNVGPIADRVYRSIIER